MNYLTPLQNLLHNLLPFYGHSDSAPAQPEFADTCRDEDRPDPAPPRRKFLRAAADRDPPSNRRQSTGWAESSSDLMEGAEIMECPDDTAADLMNEYFPAPAPAPAPAKRSA
jgi:hypothetical protein